MTGYKLPAELSSGDPLDLIFWWQTGSQALTAPYAQFIHLFRTTDNTFVAGYDAQPFDGRFPTEVWPANLQIMDERTIQLPDDLPPGEYELFTGMYDTMTKERLPITVNGESLPNGIVSIGTFRIQ
jgi:hypothetical protein